MSVTDGTLTTDEAQQTVRIKGSITTTPGAGTQTVSGTVTANQGTANTSANGWPVKVTDGTIVNTFDGTDGGLNVHVRNTTNIPVSVSGTTAVSGTVTGNQGAATTNSLAWPFKITNGTSTADLAPSAASSQGNALLVTTGILNAPATLTAASSTGAGTTVDFGAAKQCITIVVTSGAGVSGGVVTLQLSQDNANWYNHTGTITTSTASTVFSVSVTGVAFRYARANITTAITGGNVAATIQGT